MTDDNRWGDLNRDGQADWKDDALGDLIVFHELQRQNRERQGLAPPPRAAGSGVTDCLAVLALMLLVPAILIFGVVAGLLLLGPR